MTALQAVEPLLTAVAAFLTTVVLVVVVRLSATQLAAVKEQKAIVEERLQNSKEDLERTEKWYVRRIDELEGKLATILNDQGITRATPLEGSDVVGHDAMTLLDSVVGQLQALLTLDAVRDGSVPVDPETYLELGQALWLSEDWLGAAAYYELYLREEPRDWLVHFSLGAALANSRRDDESNLRALRAYSDAIAFAPRDADDNMLARMHTYRGATLKRLDRLDEAESEFELSLKLATEAYERSDAHYNLASLYARRGERDQVLRHVGLMDVERRGVVLDNPYFDDYADDAELNRLVHG